MKKTLIIMGATLVVLIGLGAIYRTDIGAFIYRVAAKYADQTVRKGFIKDFPSFDKFSPYVPLFFSDSLRYCKFAHQGYNQDYRTILPGKAPLIVSVVDGYHIEYCYPDTKPFAVMIVDQSNPDHYEKDKATTIELLNAISKEAWADKYKPALPEIYKGQEYYYESFNPAASRAIGMALHFFPKDHIIATVFFLNQNPKERQWQTLQDYSFCKDRFIRELIDHVNE